MLAFAKGAVKKILSQVGIEVHRKKNNLFTKLTPQSAIDDYFSSNQRPWSNGYGEQRRKYISQALADDKLTLAISTGQKLPQGYGFALCERCVEYPWILSRVDQMGATVLDAGSTLNHDFILDHPNLSEKLLTILTLAPEWECHWQRGISYVFGDLRKTPFRDNYFDGICCISTLEHIGLDNTQFTGSHSLVDSKTGDYVDAIRELRRIVRPGGTVLVSVPFGVIQNSATTLVFSEEMLTRLIEAFNPAELEQQFFRYDKNGWQPAAQEECESSIYQPWIMTPSNLRATECPIDKDHAAAARSVVCLSLKK